MAYTYDEYMSTQRSERPYQGTQYVGGNNNQSGFHNSSYVYNPDWSTQKTIWENVKRDFSGPQGYASLHSPVSAITRAYRGRSAIKEAKARARAWKRDAAMGKERASSKWLDTFDPTSGTAMLARDRARSGHGMTLDEIEASFNQENEAKQRGAYERSIEEYFADPARASWQQGIVQNRLTSDLAGIRETYDTELTDQGQGAAARGVKGGSSDIEGRADVERARNTRAIGAAADADTGMADFQARDRQSRAQLLGMVNSGNIADSNALRSALDSIHSTTAAEGARFASGQRQQQINRFGNQMQSQAIGQGLGAISQAIQRNPNAWYAGGSGSSGGSGYNYAGGW